MKTTRSPGWAKGRPTLGVLLPVYNESRTIVELLERVFERGHPDQVVVVDDGSTDDTAALVRTSRFASNLELVVQPKNGGKGSALRAGIPWMRTDLTVIQDGDLEYDPADYDRLVNELVRSGSSVVYGSRNLTRINPNHSLSFLWGGLFVTWATNLLFGTHLTDEPTCYKMFRTDLLQALPLRCEGFEFCPEVTGLVARAGFDIPEVPIGYVPRSLAEGKKIRPRDGFEALATLWQTRNRPIQDLLPAAGPQADPEVLSDLLQMHEATHYNRWILERFAPYLGDRVLELDAGIGSRTELLLQAGKHVVSLDPRADLADVVRHRTAAAGAHVQAGELGVTPIQDRFDSVLAIGTLERAEDPPSIVAAAWDRLLPGGRLLVHAAATPAAYGVLDRALGHRRRFTRDELGAVLRTRPWTIELLRYTNPIGLAGWVANSRLASRSHQSLGQVLAFDRLAIPLQRHVERRFVPTVGQSLIAVARR